MNIMRNKLILLFLITFLIVGCGSRKVNKSVTKEETQIEILDTSKTETKTDTNTKVITCFESDEITIVPIDSTKEIFVNGKTYRNVVLKHKKVKANKVVEQSKKEVKIEQKAVKTNIKKQTQIEVKQIDKEPFNFLVWFWLLLLIPIYLLYRKYKHKFTNVG
jgi:uncharacterized protein YcfL